MKSLATAALAALIVSTVLTAPPPAAAQPAIQQVPVQFKKGESRATVKGSLKGDQTIDYVLRASAGQTITIHFKPSNASAYFNLLPTGKEEAIHIGSTSGNDYTGALPANGDYSIRVFLMRNAARRHESVSYTLDIAIQGATGKTSAAPVAAPVATNAGPARWDASGDVKCSSGSDRFDRMCGFRVVRDLGKKSADVWIANAANGQADYRYLHYQDKVFTTNGPSKLAWQRQDDNWWVSVDGREFYFIPDALIHGG